MSVSWLLWVPGGGGFCLSVKRCRGGGGWIISSGSSSENGDSVCRRNLLITVMIVKSVCDSMWEWSGKSGQVQFSLTSLEGL